MKNTKNKLRTITMTDDFLRHYLSNTPEFLKPLNLTSIEGWQNKKIVENYEPLIALNGYDKHTHKITQLHKRILAKPAYFEQNSTYGNIPDALPIMYVRASLIDLLLKYIDQLPNNYGLIIYDGYRPFSVQESIYNSLFNEEKLKFPNLTDKEIQDKIKNLVLPPKKSPTSPPQHNTGGSVDFYIYNLTTGKILDIGCEFDDFREIAHINYFQSKYNLGEQLTDEDLKIMLNRNVMGNISTFVGFSLYPDEIWHLNYGTQTDSNKESAIYGSVKLSHMLLNPNNNIATYICQNKELSNHIKYLDLEVIR